MQGRSSRVSSPNGHPFAFPAGVPASTLERLLARVLRPFAKVEPHEAITAAIMTFIVFVLMTAYYLLKTAREPLILLQGGAEVKVYAEAGQAVLLVGVVRAYGAIARRVGRMKLLAIVYLFFTSNMLIFGLLDSAGIDIGLAFFFWVGIFSYTSIAQFWAFAADIYTEEQGKRLFPIVGIGSSIGAVVGATVAKGLLPLGSYALMCGAAALVVVCVALLAWVERRERTRTAGSRKPASQESVADKTPFHLLLSDRYLLLIGALILLLNCVSGEGEYILDRTLLSRVGEADALGISHQAFVGSFKASYFAWYNGLGVVLQLFAVSRILSRFGVRNALLVLPAIALLGYATFAAIPALAVIRVVKIIERGLDYSLTNTSRHALFLVATRTEKYVGKTMVDTVGARLGDFVCAATVWIGSRVALPMVGFATIAIVLIVVWLAVVLAIGHEYARRRGAVVAAGAPDPVPS